MAIESFTELEGVRSEDVYYEMGVQKIRYISQLATNVKNGWRDPDYQRKIDLKDDASLPYKRFHHEIIQPMVYSCRSINKKTKQEIWGTRIGPFTITAEPHTLPASPAMDDLAIKRFKTEFGESYRDFQALVPLAEIRETRDLIKTTAALTERLLLDLITIKSKRARKDLVALAGDLWLQYSFAISPTIGDIEQLLTVIGDHIGRHDKGNVKVSKGSRETYSYTGNEQFYSLGGYCAKDAFKYRLIRHVENGYRYTGAYDLLLSSSNDYSLSERMGFSLKALPSVGWELIPFSWVLDYFGTIGAYLDDRITSPPSNTIYLTRSQRYRVVQTIAIGDSVPLTGWTTYDRETTPYVYSFNAFERKVMPSLPHRALRFKTYSEVTGSTMVNKLLNLGSILVSGRR